MNGMVCGKQQAVKEVSKIFCLKHTDTCTYIDTHTHRHSHTEVTLKYTRDKKNVNNSFTLNFHRINS